MKEWKKVAYFANGVIYTCGNKRKIVIPGNLDIYYEVKTQEARWYRPASIRNPTRQRNHGVGGIVSTGSNQGRKDK